MIWVPVAVITAAHYLTGEEFHWLHDIFRRLYYIPIILAAFQHGLAGSLTASIVVSIAYLPHAFAMSVSAHAAHGMVVDPASGIEKFLEILLYNVVQAPPTE